MNSDAWTGVVALHVSSQDLGLHLEPWAPGASSTPALPKGRQHPQQLGASKGVQELGEQRRPTKSCPTAQAGCRGVRQGCLTAARARHPGCGACWQLGAHGPQVHRTGRPVISVCQTCGADYSLQTVWPTICCLFTVICLLGGIFFNCGKIFTT